jgi:type I restriction enzyme M protein
MSGRARFASERDFVAQFLLPKLKEAAGVVGVADVTDFHVEKRINGTPDLTAERGGKRLFIIEAKFKKKVAKIERDIEPRDPDVVGQAANYATLGGFPYYSTCNSKRLILFQMKPGVKAYESEIASFDYERDAQWAEKLLKIVVGIMPISLKPLHDTLVDILHEAFNDLYPEFLTSLEKRLKDKTFLQRYVDWLESQGTKFGDETNRLIAEQTTYLQLNKLIFYQVLRTIYPQKLRPLKISEEEDVSEALSQFFEDVIKIDYAPIYQIDVISQVPMTKRTEERIRTLLDTINEFDFSKMESDFIGRIYEKLIPPQERKRLGQFYTPPAIVDLIVELTVTDRDDVVLDPGCGSGSFLVRAYHRLRELNHIPRVLDGPLQGRIHQQLLDHLYGVDINQFPAHLTVINLAVQNPKARIERVNIAVNDIFDVKPGQATLLGFKSITTEGKPALVHMPPYLDAVVANPPYIRQELLGKKEKRKIESLIENEYKDELFVGRPPKKKRGVMILDKQSDMYIYFFIHALKFLKNGKRLGFIASNKWLEVGYGEPFQQFLLAHTKLLYIIEFDKAVFPDAEVNTAVTIFEKAEGQKNNQARLKSKVKFVHINKALPLDRLISRVQTEDKADDENLRITAIAQEKIRPGKWNVFLRAPPVYFEIVGNPALKPLGQVSEIVRGFTTGYDPYFILNKEKAREWKIEGKYLKPCAPAGKALTGFIIEPKDISQYFLIVRERLSELQGSNVLDYIKFGEKLDAEPSKRRRERVRLPEVETIKNREPWYSLPELKPPSIFFPMWFRYKYRPLLNNANAHGRDFYYYITIDQSDREVLVALLYSTLTQFLLELTGRQYSGMLHTKVYELKSLPILDPNGLNDSEKKRFRELALELDNTIILRDEAQEKLSKFTAKSKGQEGLFEKEFKSALEKAKKRELEVISQIDEMIYNKLGLSKVDQIAVSRGLQHLRQVRKLATRGLNIET